MFACGVVTEQEKKTKEMQKKTKEMQRKTKEMQNLDFRGKFEFCQISMVNVELILLDYSDKTSCSAICSALFEYSNS